MFELNVIEDVVLTYCHGIVISAVLGRNSQNKPNGFSIHVVLRSGAEIEDFKKENESLRPYECFSPLCSSYPHHLMFLRFVSLNKSP